MKKRTVKEQPKHSISEKVEPSILLHPPIPDPMHGIAPRVVMGTSSFNKLRKEVYARQDYHCLCCGVHKEDADWHKWLECHEFYNVDYRFFTMEILDYVALCHACHNFIHSTRLGYMEEKGEISSYKKDTIMERGYGILESAGLLGQYLKINEFAKSVDYTKTWNLWRMVYRGWIYKSQFEDAKAWRLYYDTDSKLRPKVFPGVHELRKKKCPKCSTLQPEHEIKAVGHCKVCDKQ